MNKRWLISITFISLLLLLILKTHEKRTLVPYFKSEQSLKLGHFAQARKHLTPQELPLLELWESMLTGRVAPLDRWLREEYKTLALAHVFTPSGFHLSALLWPLLLVFRKKVQKLWILSFFGLGLLFLPGQAAMKRMTLVKIQQQFFGLKTGFLLAFILDLLFGSLQTSPLSFTYSFLFLGIIYSGARGLTMVIWFYIAQILIAFVQGSFISPLLLLTSPIINSLLALALPLLVLLAYPLWLCQLKLGIFILNVIQVIVSASYKAVMEFPVLEVNTVFLLLTIFFLFKQSRMAILTCLLLSGELNTSTSRVSKSGTYEWHAHGRIIKVVRDKIYRDDGICKRTLVNGVWFETCSPRRRSRKKIS